MHGSALRHATSADSISELYQLHSITGRYIIRPNQQFDIVAIAHELQKQHTTMPAKVRTIDVGSGPLPYFAGATATTVSELIHVSGQVGVNSEGKAPADYVSQVHLALLSLQKVLLAAGAQVGDILKLNLYPVNYNPDNRQHAKPLQQFLGSHRPAVTLIPVSQLAFRGWLFEVEAVAAKHGIPSSTSIGRTLRYDVPAVEADVIILGAGLAGLTAAHKVLESGHTRIVLEARDRVGGRTHSKAVTDGEGVVDLGAAWINDTNQSRMISLARRFGFDLIEQNTNGQCSLQDETGEISTFAYGDLPHVRFSSS
jgi:monoamine oxidase